MAYQLLGPWEEDFLLGVPPECEAFVCATETVAPLVEQCERAIVDQCAAVFAAVTRRENEAMNEKGHDGAAHAQDVSDAAGGPLLPEGLADEVMKEMSTRRLWTNDLVEFALRRVSGVVDLSAQPRVTQLGPILNDNSAGGRNLKLLRLRSMCVRTQLVLHDRPLLEEIEIESTTLPGLSLANCPRLSRIDIHSFRSNALHVGGCPALESFVFSGNQPVNDVVKRVVEECPNLRRLRYHINIQSTPLLRDDSEEPFTIRLEDRESQLEELSLLHISVQALRLTGGCPRLTTLQLSSLPFLHSVHITDARSLTHLHLVHLNTWRSLRGRSYTGSETSGDEEEEEEEEEEDQAVVRIENASKLVKVEIKGVNAHFLDSLAHLGEAIQSIDIFQSRDSHIMPCAATLSRMLQSGPPLVALKSVRLEVTNGIDGFVLDNAAALPSLERLCLHGRPIRNVTLSLPSLTSVQLRDVRSKKGADDDSMVREDDLIDGRVSIADAGGQLKWLQLCRLRVRDLHLNCPSVTGLGCISTYVPPHELARWPTVLTNLRSVDYFGMSDEDALHAFPSATYRYLRQDAYIPWL